MTLRSAAGIPERLPFRYLHLRLVDGNDGQERESRHRLGMVITVVQ